MSSSIVIHVQRPYASEDEYLAHERSSIEAKTMLLIDQPPLPVNTAVVFDVSLQNGHKPIRAEGKVIGYVNAEGTQHGGLRVRFKRYGAATKAFIDRAIGAPAGASTPSSPSLLPEPERLEVAMPDRITPEPPMPATGPAITTARDPEESSGVHRKAVLPVPAPANREALLARLRGRRTG